MAESIIKYSAEDKSKLPRAIAKEKDGIVMYFAEELQREGISQRGLSRLLECNPKTVAVAWSCVTPTAIFEAEIVTESGVKTVTLMDGEGVADLLLELVGSKAKVETRNLAKIMSKKLIAAGFKLAVMLELAPEQLAAQAVRNAEDKELLKLRKDVLTLEDKTLSLRHYVVTALPKAQADRILGVTEIKTTEIKEVVVNERGQILGHLPGESYNKRELCERYGIVTRTGKPDYRQINAHLAGLNLPNEAWEDRQVVSHNAQLKAEFLPQLDKLIGKVDRQAWIGE
jgi:hypothetical protein